MQKKGLFIAIAALLTTIILAISFEKWLDREIEEQEHLLASTLAMNQYNTDYTKDNGVVMMRKMLENDNLMLLGSSELDSDVAQNPRHLFPNRQLPSEVAMIGHAYMQDLLHGMKVGMPEFGSGDKVALVVSLQWFYGEDIDRSGFAGNFSEIQFYNTLDNPKLSRDTKIKLSRRTAELLEEIQGYEDIKVYAKLVASESGLAKGALKVLQPYYELKKYGLRIKDKWATYQVLQKYEEGSSEVQEIDWEAAAEEAEEMGTAACTNNEFYVEDWYYDTYLKDEIGNLKDTMADEKLLSREMEDYELLLQICQENEVDIYLIFMNTNGTYYDYAGIDQETRIGLYQRLMDRADQYSFDYLDLSQQEYEPYFMIDVMHLGWKGWLTVDEALTEHFSEVQE